MPHGSAMRALEVALEEAARGTAVRRKMRLRSIHPLCEIFVVSSVGGCGGDRVDGGGGGGGSWGGA